MSFVIANEMAGFISLLLHLIGFSCRYKHLMLFEKKHTFSCLNQPACITLASIIDN